MFHVGIGRDGVIRIRKWMSPLTAECIANTFSIGAVAGDIIGTGSWFSRGFGGRFPFLFDQLLFRSLILDVFHSRVACIEYTLLPPLGEDFLAISCDSE